MLTNKKIAVLGAGKMGGAIIGGLRRADVAPADQIWAADIRLSALESLQTAWGVHITQDKLKAISAVQIVILAVKPQQLPELLEEIWNVIDRSYLVISIAAGTPLGLLQEKLGEDRRLIRVMPNLPAKVGAGVSALCRGGSATVDDLDVAGAIFKAVGEVVVVEEAQMDAVTALSGSGPGYMMLVIESLADAGVKLGLARPTALKLASHTVLGSAKLLIESGLHPAQIKDQVCSPGGTTIAGISVLEQFGLRAALISAVEAAACRSQELGDTSGAQDCCKN